MLSLQKKIGTLIVLDANEQHRIIVSDPCCLKADEARKRGRLGTALRLYNRALHDKPDCAKAWLGKGSIFLTRRKYSCAEICFRNGLEIEPESFTFHLQLALALEKNEKLPEAVEHCLQVVRLCPGYTAHHVRLARLYHDIGKWEEGIRHCQLALRCPDLQRSELRKKIESLIKGFNSKAGTPSQPRMPVFINLRRRILLVQE